MILCGDSVRIWPLHPELRDLYHFSVSGFQSVVGGNKCLSEPSGCLLKMQIKIYRHGAQESTLQAGFVDASYKTVAQN